MNASDSQTYAKADGWLRKGNEKVPIAMRLSNHAHWAYGYWRGALSGIETGRLWWVCFHDHLSESAAQECARGKWFEHHG